jgi:hypothetical protein
VAYRSEILHAFSHQHHQPSQLIVILILVRAPTLFLFYTHCPHKIMCWKWSDVVILDDGAVGCWKEFNFYCDARKSINAPSNWKVITTCLKSILKYNFHFFPPVYLSSIFQVACFDLIHSCLYFGSDIHHIAPCSLILFLSTSSIGDYVGINKFKIFEHDLNSEQLGQVHRASLPLLLTALECTCIRPVCLWAHFSSCNGHMAWFKVIRIN